MRACSRKIADCCVLGVDNGVFIDTDQIVGGYAYCYRGAVEKLGEISAVSDIVSNINNNNKDNRLLCK